MAGDSQYLYLLLRGTGAVSEFHVAPNGGDVRAGQAASSPCSGSDSGSSTMSLTYAEESR